mmetsp:Transcript_33544/g.73919  ORF Transcript_33544/g.73919 Transcript_33544/m.73919 type:complete len:265 (-) Transcript_33544:51-845(-)
MILGSDLIQAVPRSFLLQVRLASTLSSSSCVEDRDDCSSSLTGSISPSASCFALSSSTSSIITTTSSIFTSISVSSLFATPSTPLPPLVCAFGIVQEARVLCVLIDFPCGNAKYEPIVFCCIEDDEGDCRGLFFVGAGEVGDEDEDAADADDGCDCLTVLVQVEGWTVVRVPTAVAAALVRAKCADTATSTTAFIFSSSVDQLLPVPTASSASATSEAADRWSMSSREHSWVAAVSANVIASVTYGQSGRAMSLRQQHHVMYYS